MTKYHAKGMQTLSSVVRPLGQSLLRCEAEERVSGENVDVAQKVRSRLRRFMFAANKCQWYSCCELAVFVLTGGHCIQTHASVPVFTSRAHYQAQECKRFLNGECCGGVDREAEPVMQTVTALIVGRDDGGAVQAGVAARDPVVQEHVDLVAEEPTLGSFLYGIAHMCCLLRVDVR